MAIEDILGVFGNGKRDKEAAEKFYNFLNAKFDFLADNQIKLMEQIKALSEKVESLSSKIEEMQMPSSIAIDSLPETYATPSTSQSYSHTPSMNMDVASAHTPAPFYASLEDGAFIPADDDMKENVFFRVVPSNDKTATVEFNSLCANMCLDMGYSILEDYFDIDLISKEPNHIEPENTTSARYENGEWVVEGKIRLRLV